jgi:hypothetical protein
MFKKVFTVLISATITLPIAFFAVQPAAAADQYDGDNAATIALEQLPTKVSQVSDPGTAPSSSNCDQPFPASPVVVCGTATFSEAYANNVYGNRTTSGLPGNWTSVRGKFGQGKDSSTTYGNQWSQSEGSKHWWVSRSSKDLAIGGSDPISLTGNLSGSTGTTMQYMTKSVGWRDIQNWSVGRHTEVRTQKTEIPAIVVVKPKTITTTTKGACRSVYDGYKCGNKACTTGTAVYKKVCSPDIITKEVIPGYTIYPEPQTVDRTEIVDEIWGGSGSFNPVTYSVPGIYTTVIYKHFWFPLWQDRQVTYGGYSYYPTPETRQIWCQSELGPGKMYGPLGHDGKPLNSQIGFKETDLDPQTILRSWWTRPQGTLNNFIKEVPNGGFILLSKIGERAENAPNSFVRGNSSIENLVLDCIKDKPSYIASATNQPCEIREPGHPLYGQELPASNELCQTFVPGNYNKDLSESKEMLCTYTIRDWVGFNTSGGKISELVVAKKTTAAERITFIHCGTPVQAQYNPDRPSSPNSIGYPTTKAFWACAGDTPEKGNRMWHPDSKYNFLTCGITYSCVSPGVPDLRPVILDLNSNTSSRGSSQILASGAQTEVSWAVPTRIIGKNSQGNTVSTIVVDKDAENIWQEWDILTGSSPWYFNKKADDVKQPIFGSNIKNVNPSNSDSILDSGVNNWDTRSIYLRGYKGTSLAKNSTNVGGLPIPAKSLIPFGVTTKYSLTLPKTTKVFGKNVTINQPVSCSMPNAYLYYLSGRATG